MKLGAGVHYFFNVLRKLQVKTLGTRLVHVYVLLVSSLQSVLLLLTLMYTHP